MKINTFIITLVLVLLSSCSQENKAKKAIKEELRLTLHDFKSYEPLQFGKIEVAFSSYEDLPEIGLYLDNAKEWVSISREYDLKAQSYREYYLKDQYYVNFRLYEKALDSAKFFMNKVERIKVEYRPEIVGWKMIHSYRAKNLEGNLGIHHHIFYLDKELSKVTKTVDISDN